MSLSTTENNLVGVYLSTTEHVPVGCLCLAQGMFVYHRACLSTTGNLCLPQGICVYHRECCRPQGMFVYVVLMCMLTHLLPCPLARRTHLWTGTAGTACSEQCQAEAWPAGMHLGCRSADTRAALLHHHATAEAAPEPGRCIVNSQQVRSFLDAYTPSCTHLFLH